MLENFDKVTIAITCYNAVETLERALRSAQRQSWPNLEILVVDDCSSDGSPELVENLIADDPRVRLIRREENGGASAARNTLIEVATGEFIVFFDDDDESHPERVSRQLAVLRAFESNHPGAPAACYAGGERLYPNGYIKALPAIGSKGRPLHGVDVANYLLFFARPDGLFFGSGTPTCALLVRRSVLVQLGGFDVLLRRVEDIDLAIRLALVGGYFLGTSECLFRQYSTKGPDKSPEANLNAEIKLAKKYQQYLNSIGCYHYATRWPNLRYLHFKHRYAAFLLEFMKIFVRYPVKSLRHILTTGPRRLRHERRMRKRSK